MIGESPTRPGIFQAIPLVVVVADISPLLFRAMQLMVPVVGFAATSNAQAISSSLASGNRRFSSACFDDAVGGASVIDSQFVWPLRSRISRFHASHAMRDRSVNRSSS